MDLPRPVGGLAQAGQDLSEGGRVEAKEIAACGASHPWILPRRVGFPGFRAALGRMGPGRKDDAHPLRRRRLPDRPAQPLDRVGMRANTDRIVSLIDSALAGRALPAGAPAGLPRVRPRRSGLRRRGRAARETGRADPQRAHRPAGRQSPHRGRLHPERDHDRGRPALAGRALQHHLPDRARGGPLQVPQGQPLDPLRGARQPARSAGLRRAALPRGRNRDRPDRRRHLLRLDLPRGDPAAGRQRGRGADPRLGLHGPVGRTNPWTGGRW